MLGLLALILLAAATLIVLLSVMLAWEMVHPPRRTAAYAIARGLPCDPGDLGLEFDEWMIDLGGGARSPVWDFRGRAPLADNEGARLVGVFIHGWGGSRIDWLQRIEPFLTQLDRLVLLDGRGHGDSEAPTTTLGGREAADVKLLLERLGEPRVLLVGHSMGAVTAISAAMRRGDGPDVEPTPESIAGVIAYAPYCDFHQSLRGRLRAAGFPTRPMTDLALFILRMTGVKPLSMDDESLRRLAVPLLVVHGAEDAVVPLAQGQRICAAAIDAVLHEVPAAAHADAHSIDPQQHETVVARFIDRVRAGGRDAE